MFSIWNNYTVSDRFALNLGVIYQDESVIKTGSSAILPAYARVEGKLCALENTIVGLNIENLQMSYISHSHSITKHPLVHQLTLCLA